jgi:hypothetical protein
MNTIRLIKGLILFSASFSLFNAYSGTTAQITIPSLNDSWNGGRFKIYNQRIDSTPDSLIIQTGGDILWDFRHFQYDSTISIASRALTDSERMAFPKGNRIIEDYYNSFTYSYYTGEKVSYVEQREDDALLRVGHLIYKSASDTNPVRQYYSPNDTLFKFPIKYGDTLDRSFDISMPENTMPPGTRSYFEPIRTTINSYGRIVLSETDTLQALGAKAIGELHIRDTWSDYKSDLLCHAFMLITREYGVTAYLHIACHPSTDGTKYFTPGHPTDLRDNDLQVFNFIVRIPDTDIGNNTNENYRILAFGKKAKQNEKSFVCNALGRRYFPGSNGLEYLVCSNSSSYNSKAYAVRILNW